MLFKNIGFLLNGCSDLDLFNNKNNNDNHNNDNHNDNKINNDPNANLKIWKKIGQDIDGDNYGDYSGFSVSLSDDGNIVAIGAYGSNKSTGIVRIFKNINNTWTKMGQDIKGSFAHDNTGYSVSLNSDGSIIAVGATQSTFFGPANPFPGYVRIFQFSQNSWIQIGQDIDGEKVYDNNGISVSLSSDGNIVAIGADHNDSNGFAMNSGHVRIFKNINNFWTQIGQDIDGEAAYDLSGYSVSLNSSGNIVAIGAYKNDGDINNPKLTSGHVRIFQFSQNSWIQMGQDIDGLTTNNYSGYSVSLNSSGNIIAIGSPFGGFNKSGHVRIFQFQNNSWIQIGKDISGEFQYDTSGYSVSLNSSGNIIAIGAPFGGGGTGHQGAGGAGSVRIYQNINNSWIKIGQDIDGEFNDDMSGYSVSINADGSIIAIGAIFNNLFKGHVRIYAR